MPRREGGPGLVPWADSGKLPHSQYQYQEPIHCCCFPGSSQCGSVVSAFL
uniref:Uncharacterized protein n=1 Tax=Anguilla anguilla TaxID=7936 RepID=A0A0E9TZH9_ANGAN